MTKDEFFVELATVAIQDGASIQEGLGCMIVLHTCHLRPDANVTLEDAGKENMLAPLTRRHAAETVAKSMKALGRQPDPEYWYREYDIRCPFEVAEDVTIEWRSVTDKVIRRMEASILTDAVAE